MKHFSVQHRINISKSRLGKFIGEKSPLLKREENNKYGMLTVLSYAGQKRTRGALWHCRCDCGGEIVTDGAHLRNGHTQSCGCLHKRKGKDHPSWKGTGYFSKDYLYVYAPNHPNARGKGYVSKHVLVMSQHIGRGLKRGEIVHHKNGDRKDNRMENLELRTINLHPPGQSVTDLVKYAVQVLTEYAPDLLCPECHEKKGEQHEG